MYHIYGIKNCDTMKKALNWLNTHGIDYVFNNYKTDGLSSKQLKQLLTLADWKVLLNTKGSTYRKLDDKTKAKIINATEAEKVMLANPSIIKRPILVKNGQALVGFSSDSYHHFCNGEEK